MEQVITSSVLRKLLIIVIIGISANLLFVFFTSEASILESLSTIKWYYYLLIIACILCYWIGHGFRISLWSAFIGQKIPIKEGVLMASYTDLGAAVSPTVIGGGPVKLGLLLQKGLSPGKAGFVTILGGLEDIVMYLTALFLCIYYTGESAAQVADAILSFFTGNWKLLLLIATLLIIANQIVRRNVALQIRTYIPYKYKKAYGRFVLGIKNAMREMIESGGLVLKQGKLKLLLSFSVLLLQWTAKFSILLILLKALNVDFEIFITYIREWVVYLSMMMFPTPGATGGAETIFYYVFEDYIPASILPVIIALWRFGTYYMFLFLSIMILQYNLLRARE